MRLKAIEPLWFVLLAVLCVAVLVFQVITLLVALWIAPQGNARPDGLVIVALAQSQSVVSSTGVFRAERPSRAQFGKYYPVLMVELLRYDDHFLRSLPLRQIFLCSRLTLVGKCRGGFTVGSGEMIYLNLTLPEADGERQLRRAIHHELFHVIDTILPAAEVDESWAAMNPEGFRYGGDEILEALEITGESPSQRTDVPGLLSLYCMVSAREDRAEIFSYMMVCPDSLELIVLSDEIIGAKAAYLKQKLTTISPGFSPLEYRLTHGNE